MLTHHIIRDRLKQELSKRGLSAVELAKSASVKTSFIYDILNSKSTNPSTLKLGQVAEALGVSLSYLAGISADPSPAQGQGAHGDYVHIPQLLVRTQGSDASIATESLRGAISFSREWLNAHFSANASQLRFWRVATDCMSPTLQSGDTVLVNTEMRFPSPPGIFIIFDGKGLTAKRLEYTPGSGSKRLSILSDNPRYTPHESPLEQVNVIGRVIWFARSL